MDATLSLNALFGADTKSADSRCRSHAQTSVHRHLFEAVARGQPPPVVAARELLGNNIDCSRAMSAVRPYSGLVPARPSSAG